MEQLKMIIAGNIGQLRRDAGMTQLELAEYLKSVLRKDDAVIFKASRGMKFEEIINLVY